MTEGWIFAVCAFALCYFFCVPFTIYTFIRFRRLSQTDLYQQRYPNIVKYLTLLCILSYLIEKPLTFICFTSPFRLSILWRFDIILYCLFSRSYLYLMLLRYWLLFYCLHLNKYQSNSKWKKHLNPHHDAHDFWFLHRNHYGSKRYCFRILFVCYLMDTILLLALYQIFLNDSRHFFIVQFIDSLFYIIATIFMLILGFKVPQFIDNHLITKELHYVCVTLLSAAVFYIACIYFATFSNSSFITHIIQYIVPSISICLTFCLQQICTFCVTSADTNTSQDELILQPVQSSTHSTISTDGVYNNDITSHSKLISLPMILSNAQSFELFALYLMEEYSLEIILCFVELLEFKKAFKRKYLRYLNDDESFYEHEFDVEYMNEYIDVNIDGCSSFIVDSNLNRIDDETHDVLTFIQVFHNIIYILYNKYIDTNAKFAVTLSIEHAAELKEYIIDHIINSKYDANNSDDITYLKNIYQYFDDMLSELYLCMDPAYQRFVRCLRFREIVCKIFNSKVKQKGCCCKKTMFIAV